MDSSDIIFVSGANYPRIDDKILESSTFLGLGLTSKDDVIL